MGSENQLDFKKIVKQLEYYFSDFNMVKDKFMQDHAAANKGWFTFKTMLNFKQLGILCNQEPNNLLQAINQHLTNSELLEVDLNEMKVRRNVSKPLPENNEEYQLDLKLRTVMVSGFPGTETIEDITSFLEEYGPVDGLKLNRFQDKHKGSLHKGSGFVAYKDKTDAEKFLNTPMVTYKDKQLNRVSKTEFNRERNKKQLAKRRKKEEMNKKTAPVEKAPEVVVVDTTAYLYLTGIDDESINHNDMKALFQVVEAPKFKAFSRIQGTSTGWIAMLTKELAEKAVEIMQQNFGDEFALKESAHVKISMALDEQVPTLKELHNKFKARFASKGDNKNKNGKFQSKVKRKNTSSDIPCNNKKHKKF